jgi:uncharacterized membrane protein
MNARLLSAVCALAIAVLANAVLAGATFTRLGDFPGGRVLSQAKAVSADGLVVVGDSESDLGLEVFRWTSAATGLENLGNLGSSHLGTLQSFMGDISADGSVVVGSAFRGGTNFKETFRWTSATGMVGIGGTSASGVSADGSVIVGNLLLPSEAYRWTSATGFVRLGTLSGGSSRAMGVSDDGSVIVGDGHITSPFHVVAEAFRWTSETGIVGLGFLSEPSRDFDASQAKAISGDGLVIVGSSVSGPFNLEAFRWTSETGMVALSDVPGANTPGVAYAASYDGSVIVGTGVPDAFRWTIHGGAQSIAQMLTAGGIDLGDLRLDVATGVSADGNIIVGYAAILVDGIPRGSEAWIADLGTNPIADVSADPAELLMPGLVGLDGSLSFDPDGDSITHFWTLSTPPGSSAVLDDPTSITPSFTVDVFGNYMATLVVTDVVGLVSDPDSVTVGFENLAPEADAGPNQAVVVGDTVFLDGMGSTDMNMDMLSYLWSFVGTPAGSSSILITPTAISPNFVPDLAGDYSVQLIVNDGLVNSPPDTVVITVIDMADAAAQGALDLITAINMLPSDDFVNRNMQRALTNMVIAILRMIDRDDYLGALNSLELNVLSKTDGCAMSGSPDSNDWLSCDAQSIIYPLVLVEIELLRRLI